MSHLPSTPRVISPSPTPSDISSRDGYFTRSVARRSRVSTPAPVPERGSPDPETRARTRSRSPVLHNRMAPLTTSDSMAASKRPAKQRGTQPGEANGHLAPPEDKSYWRQLSRSPSPLGLIPVHLEFRQFVSACFEGDFLGDPSLLIMALFILHLFQFLFSKLLKS